MEGDLGGWGDPSSSNAALSVLEAWLAGSLTLPCLPPITPPSPPQPPPLSHQSLVRPGSMRQAALFTGWGPEELGRSSPASGSDLGHLRVGLAPQVPPGSRREGPHGQVAQPHLRGPDPWPAPAACSLYPPSPLPAILQEPSQVGDGPEAGQGEGEGEVEGASLVLLGTLLRLPALPVCPHLPGRETEAQATFPKTLSKVGP